MFYENNKNWDGSFIKMPTSKVAEMAQKTLEWIKKTRAERTQKCIEKERRYMMDGFWHRFWKRPVPTDEQVINEIKKEYLWNQFQMIDLSFGTTEATAERLLMACKHADEIYISMEDLQRIS